MTNAVNSAILNLLRIICILGAVWNKLLNLWSHTITQINMWGLLDNSSLNILVVSVLGLNVKTLNSAVVSRYLLLESSLRLMARRL